MSKNRTLLDGVLFFRNVVVFWNIDVVFLRHLRGGRQNSEVRNQKSGGQEIITNLELRITNFGRGEERGEKAKGQEIITNYEFWEGRRARSEERGAKSEE